MFRRWTNSHREQENDESQLESKVNELRAALGPLSGQDLKYCSDACLKRYLEARSWNVDKSKKMLEETLKWRSTYKPHEIRWNTTGMDNQIRHLVYLMENAILNLPEGQEQMVWLIDFTGWTLSTSVPVKCARESINILQNHYPERLGASFLYNPPRIFEAFWKIVKYFLDPKTFQKVKFVYPMNKDSVEIMRSYFDVDNLPTEFGGKATLKYDHEEFSRLMVEDDEKTAAFWGFSDKHKHGVGNGYGGAEVVPEPAALVPPAS
ncbi:hypothetical protein RHGRI_016085 [Rhododendron griersonianum]|uniref:CRAL-TRIO domain-containing protein n=1 Tax=Rhododendron griersonianum TaxID=479676 RepID=A0AAV6JS80_9ERIC|nr:hypothetical protein RHGRI_016085 [Rhododendron griersonianum]KAG5543213.1 hypothetical protein RHGRI_016085 [Rhododendron griersonianum]